MAEKLETKCNGQFNLYDCKECKKTETCQDYLNLQESIRKLSPSKYTEAVQMSYEMTGGFI